ncbi:MAG: histidine triad nucleotide-binding protein [Anaerolineae bacterium]|nr:MAG: histidine triad nucleotide-binding protein [Anaerolineae bacterium]
MNTCIFCKIIAGEAPAEILYRDEQVTAFRDIRPVAPTHVLIVPNKHLASLNEASPDDEALLGRILLTAKKIAEMEGIQESGYRLIVNNGPDANQVIFHLHLHVIGGRRMRYPMG